MNKELKEIVSLGKPFSQTGIELFLKKLQRIVLLFLQLRFKFRKRELIKMHWALTQPISFSDAVKMHKTAVIHMRDTSKYSFLPCQVYFVAETDFEKVFDSNL